MPSFAFDTPVQAAFGAELIARLSPEVAARKNHARIDILWTGSDDRARGVFNV